MRIRSVSASLLLASTPVVAFACTSSAPPPAEAPEVTLPAPADPAGALASATPAADPSAAPPGTPAAPAAPPAACPGGCPAGQECQGPAGCEAAWSCGPARMCTRDLVEYCGCDGTPFKASGSCATRPYAKKGGC